MSKLTTYRVTIAQTIASTIDVKATNEADARDKAAGRCDRDKDLLVLDPVEGWSHEFCDYVITDVLPIRRKSTGGR